MKEGPLNPAVHQWVLDSFWRCKANKRTPGRLTVPRESPLKMICIEDA